MARMGLTRARIIETAACQADRMAPGQLLSFSEVARALGVKSPSLYNFVDGIEDIRRELSLVGSDLLRDVIRGEHNGAAGPDLIVHTANAWRAYAYKHPGLYDVAFRPPSFADEEWRASQREVNAALMRSCQLAGLPATTEAVFRLRAAIHGYITCELSDPQHQNRSSSQMFADYIQSVAADLS